ncbi:MAG: S46 family peptidase [Bacteroidales bacterium]|nr:S46 family peptidase [Bacteroidales bacterium]
MKKINVLFMIVAVLQISARAEEGMWIPMLLEQLNIQRMKDLGLKLTAEDIYSVNNSSLKDAIVQFGGSCTGNIISAQGLILTNHHCGLGAIQRQSSPQNDYLAEGFWAGSFEEELPCPGLTVTLLIRMEDVTGQVLEGVDNGMKQFQRAQIIKQNAEKIERATAKDNHYDVKIRPFYYGNQYYLFVNEIFKDIRLVGAPPSNIGNFGGDIDNWMWPRHTGDFSIFRIYANQSNDPAMFSKENVPYKPKYYLPISLKGYQKNDFTFVFGYPGSTREYIPSYGVNLTANKENPLRIGLRKQRLDIIKNAMNEDRLVRIQYTAKAKGIANYWKKMIGESKGIRLIDAISIKEDFERHFQSWADSTPERQAKYGKLLPGFKSAYHEYIPVDLSAIFISEAGQGIEVIRLASGFRELAKISKNNKTKPGEIKTATESLKKNAREFYKNYQASIDQQIMLTMLKEMDAKMARTYLPEIFSEIEKSHSHDFETYSTRLFSLSVFTDSVRMLKFLDTYKASKIKKLEKDPVFRLMTSISERYEKDIVPELRRFAGTIDSLQRIYMAGQMEMQRHKALYPDANSTLRISFGKVDNYEPADAVTYNYYTTLAGVMEKEDSAIYDYQVDARLKKLYKEKDFGAYADQDGTMHVAFTASNHTTGGNSGSPVLNAEGQLIGINFDRNWEGTLSDLMYDPSQCRNISLDIRYCLFVIDKVAGNKRLIDEMKIIQR